MADNVKIVPASCTQCGGTVEVDKGSDTAICPFCGTSFIVEKAINNYNVQNATIEHADNVNIDMTGSVKTVLDFVGDQMKESRAERREARKLILTDIILISHLQQNSVRDMQSSQNMKTKRWSTHILYPMV